jgi:tetratricopeptide (TPR) repeat protein
VRRNHEYRSAVTLWQTVVARAPRNVRGYTNLATALKDEGRPAEAEDVLRRAVALDPLDPPAQRKLGNSLLARGDFEGAVECYRRSLARADSADAQHGLGLACLRLGNAAEAAAALRTATALEPDGADHWLALGNALAALARPAEAEQAYGKALALAPELQEAHTNLGVLLLGLGRVEEALAHHERALAIPPNGVEEEVNRGQALLALGRAAEAASVFRAARERAPELPEAWAGEARALGLSSDANPEQRTQAVQFARRAVELAPKPRADLLETLAQALAASGASAEAIRCLEQALTLGGPKRNPELRARLERALEGLRAQR